MTPTESMRPRLKRHWFYLAALLTLWGGNLALAADIIDIQLRAEAYVTGPSIYLNHIAGIQAPDEEQARRLSRIRIEAAPAPGHAVQVHRSTVERCLRRYGVASAQYRLTGQGPVKVRRRYRQIEPAGVREAVKDFIMEKAPWDAEQMRVRKIRFNQPVIVPPGPMNLVVKAPKHTDWIGAVPFTVQIMVDGKRAKRVTVPVNIEVWSDVVVAAKPLGKYQPVGADTIRIEKMDLARVPKNAILDPEKIMGRRTNRNIAANTILRSDQVEIPPTVRRGDVVRVIAESPTLKIAVKGIVRQDGGPGQRVKVINMRSKRTIYAQVLDEQTVKVEF